MKRMKTEMVVFAVGIVLTGVGILSDKMFNQGIMLPVGTVLLAIAFMLGLTEKPFVKNKTVIRKTLLAIELVSAMIGALVVTGVIGV